MPVNSTWKGGNDNCGAAGDWTSFAPGAATHFVVGAGRPQITSDLGAIATLTASPSLNFIDGDFSASGAVNDNADD